MADNFNQFIANVKRTGFANSNRFRVIIPNFADSNLLLYCNATSLPGLSINTAEHSIFGETTAMPTGITYPDVSLTFYLDGDYRIKFILEDWLNQVFNRVSRKFNYYDNYVKDISIYSENREGRDVYKVNLREAYPISLSDVELDYSANSDVIKVTLGLKYKWHDSAPNDAQDALSRIDTRNSLPPNQNNFSVGGTNYISNAGSLGGMFGNVISAGPISKIATVDLTTPNFPFNSIGTGISDSFKSLGNSISPALDSLPKPSNAITNFVNDMSSGISGIVRTVGEIGDGIMNLPSILTENNMDGFPGILGNAVGQTADILLNVEHVLSNVGIRNTKLASITQFADAAYALQQGRIFEAIPSILNKVGVGYSTLSGDFNNMNLQMRKSGLSNNNTNQLFSNLSVASTNTSKMISDVSSRLKF